MPKETVLIADDDKVFVQFALDVLRSQGFQALAAFDATQALMMTQRNLPALIIVDINMPGGTGIGFLEKIRQSGKTMGIPAVAVSTAHDDGVSARLRQLNVTQYLHKPISAAALQTAVNEALGRTPPPAAPA